MRCAVNASKCIFENCEQKPILCVPEKKRCEVLKTNRIYIPKRSVICQNHFDNGDWGSFFRHKKIMYRSKRVLHT